MMSDDVGATTYAFLARLVGLACCMYVLHHFSCIMHVVLLPYKIYIPKLLLMVNAMLLFTRFRPCVWSLRRHRSIHDDIDE